MEQEATINHFVEFRLNIYASGIFWLILQIELEMSKVSSSARLNDFQNCEKVVPVVWSEEKICKLIDLKFVQYNQK